MVCSKRRPCILLAIALAVPLPSLAAVCQAKSGNTSVALLELYTSEGCNSCPPADRWLAQLPGRGFTSDRVVPLALHVDYWDSLGWTDRFAQAGFSARQRDLARRTNTRSVYTPGLMLNGREYTRWSRGGFDADLERINRQPPRADIALKLERKGPILNIEGSATTGQMTNAGLYLALYENNLRTEVRAGENRGRTLEHGFVVHRLIGPATLDAKGEARVRETLKLDAAWKSADLTVAAFVQELQGIDVLQALALAMCP